MNLGRVIKELKSGRIPISTRTLPLVDLHHEISDLHEYHPVIVSLSGSVNGTNLMPIAKRLDAQVVAEDLKNVLAHDGLNARDLTARHTIYVGMSGQKNHVIETVGRVRSNGNLVRETRAEVKYSTN